MTTTFEVLLFSVLKQKVGAGSLTVRLPAPVSGDDLLDELERQHPAIGDYRTVIRLAVNQEYVSAAVSIKDGDEVALITPVSGG